jgi:hypothetical protein
MGGGGENPQNSFKINKGADPSGATLSAYTSVTAMVAASDLQQTNGAGCLVLPMCRQKTL